MPQMNLLMCRSKPCNKHLFKTRSRSEVTKF